MLLAHLLFSLRIELRIEWRAVWHRCVLYRVPSICRIVDREIERRAVLALSDSFWIYRRYINKSIYLSIYRCIHGVDELTALAEFLIPAHRCPTEFVKWVVGSRRGSRTVWTICYWPNYMYRVGQKSKLVIFSEYVNKTEKIGGMWKNKNGYREMKHCLIFSREIFYVAIVLCLNILWLEAISEITARQTRTSLCKHDVIKVCSIEYLTARIELVLPTVIQLLGRSQNYRIFNVKAIVQPLKYLSQYNSLLFGPTLYINGSMCAARCFSICIDVFVF